MSLVKIDKNRLRAIALAMNIIVSLLPVHSYALINEDYVAATQLVNEMLADKSVRAVVEEDAPDPDYWWEWFSDLPLRDPKYVSQESIAQWILQYSKMDSISRMQINYNPLYFAREKAEKASTTFLPMGGDEHSYNPSFWANHLFEANCYAYSLNCYGYLWQTDDWYYYNPGGKSHSKYLSFDYIRTHIAQLLADDGPYFNGKTISTSYAGQYPGTRQYKIACVFSSGDFHFYRQDDNGYFSHKPGITAISQTDASGVLITNPSSSDKDFSKTGDLSALNNYYIWGGWYMVKY